MAEHGADVVDAAPSRRRGRCRAARRRGLDGARPHSVGALVRATRGVRFGFALTRPSRITAVPTVFEADGLGSHYLLHPESVTVEYGLVNEGRWSIDLDGIAAVPAAPGMFSVKRVVLNARSGRERALPARNWKIRVRPRPRGRPCDHVSGELRRSAERHVLAAGRGDARPLPLSPFFRSGARTFRCTT